jgi:hypothetical protein
MYINECLFLNKFLGLQVLKMVYMSLLVVQHTVDICLQRRGKYEYIFKSVAFILIFWYATLE